MTDNVMSKFKLDGKLFVITGGAGFLGETHAEAICEAGGIPALIDINPDALSQVKARLEAKGYRVATYLASVTSSEELQKARDHFLTFTGFIDGLVNNAAINPKVNKSGLSGHSGRFEDFPLEIWNQELAVGLTGAFLCSQIFGAAMLREKGRGGTIVNIASDLALISPDQRLYVKEGLAPDQQPAKPVTYSVIKTGLIGLTRYLSTWWAEAGIRVNALSPGGVYQNQNDEFLDKLHSLIPLGRMAERDEYKAALVFLCSPASSYMTGSNIVADGGRSVW